MTRPDKDEEREEHIHMEIIVDAYGPEEQATSWYTYLSDTLQFPFSARCVVRRTTSPLEPGEEVKVVAGEPRIHVVIPGFQASGNVSRST